MSPPRILRWPDARLRTRAAPVLSVDDGVRAVWEAMLAAMYAMPGVGLAAPQIGVMRRLAVLDCSEGADAPVRLADPELLQVSETVQTIREASPCLPGISAEVTRPARVRARYLDETGASVERDFEGLWATSLQHQIDHLDGRVFLDRLGETRRRMLLSHYMAGRKG